MKNFNHNDHKKGNYTLDIYYYLLYFLTNIISNNFSKSEINI